MDLRSIRSKLSDRCFAYLITVVRVVLLLDARTITTIRMSNTTAAMPIRSPVFVSPVDGTSVVVVVLLVVCCTLVPEPVPELPVCATTGSEPAISKITILIVYQNPRFKLNIVSIVLS